MKNVKNNLSIIIPSVIGIVLVLIGIKVQIDNTNFLKTAQMTEAIITDITTDGFGEDESHIVSIEYNVDGITYHEKLGEYDSGMYINQRIEIYYNSENPSECKGKSSKYVGFIVIIFGIIWTAVIYFIQRN